MLTTCPYCGQFVMLGHQSFSRNRSVTTPIVFRIVAVWDMTRPPDRNTEPGKQHEAAQSPRAHGFRPGKSRGCDEGAQAVSCAPHIAGECLLHDRLHDIAERRKSDPVHATEQAALLFGADFRRARAAPLLGIFHLADGLRGRRGHRLQQSAGRDSGVAESPRRHRYAGNNASGSNPPVRSMSSRRSVAFPVQHQSLPTR